MEGKNLLDSGEFPCSIHPGMKPSNPIFQKGIFTRSLTLRNEVYSKGVVYPPRDKVFKALQTTEMDQVKVLILAKIPTMDRIKRRA